MGEIRAACVGGEQMSFTGLICAWEGSGTNEMAECTNECTWCVSVYGEKEADEFTEESMLMRESVGSLYRGKYIN